MNAQPANEDGDVAECGMEHIQKALGPDTERELDLWELYEHFPDDVVHELLGGPA